MLFVMLMFSCATAFSLPVGHVSAAFHAQLTPRLITPHRGDTACMTSAVDWVQTAKYPVATAAQFGLMAAFFKAVDAMCTLPAPLVPPLFAFLSLRSRLFSLLPANRPPRGGFDSDGKKVATPVDVKRPPWTPP